MKTLFAIGVVFYFLSGWTPAFANQAVLIRILDKATVIGPQVHLGEIAEVVGENKAILEKLRRLDLGRAALVGTTLKLTQSYMKIVLRREGYSLKDFTFEGGDVVEVLTQSQEFSTGDLLPEAKSFVLKEIGESPDNLDVQLIGSEKKLLLPAGKVTPSFRPPLSGKYEGTVLLTAELQIDGHLARVLPLRMTVQVFHAVVVATKRIENGDKFTAGNVVLARKPTSALLKGSIGRLENVLGRTASVPLVPGSVIRMNDIYDPPMIKHGRTVQAVVRRGNIEITVQVRAVEDGKAGDNIRVENTATHKLLRGQVLDEKTVLVLQERP